MGLFTSCSRCKKKLLFSSLNDMGLCRECQNELYMEDFCKAEAFISVIAQKVKNVIGAGTIVPHMGFSRIEAIHKDCQYLNEHLDEWTQYPLFAAAFENGLSPYEGLKNHYSHELFPNAVINKAIAVDFQDAFAKLKKDISRTETACILTRGRAYDYSDLFRVVGVTFINDDGKDRQCIIKRMGLGYKDNDTDRVFLKKYTFGGNPAIAVFFGKDQIGNISKTDLPYFEKNWANYHRVDAYEVSGFETLGVMLRACFRGKESK